MKASAREYVWEQIKNKMINRSMNRARRNAKEELAEMESTSIYHLLSDKELDRLTNGHKIVNLFGDGYDVDLATLGCREKVEKLLQKGVNAYFSFLRNEIKNIKEEKEK